MAGTLTISTLSDGTNSTSSTNCIQGSAKAWVNFNGSTGAIRAAYNVGSITKNTTGDYTVNFTNAMSDANYAALASSGRDSNSYWDCLTSLYASGQYTTAGFRILTSATSAQQDRFYVTAAVFR